MFLVGIAMIASGLILSMTGISIVIGIPLAIIGAAMAIGPAVNWFFSPKPESAKGNPLGTAVGMVVAVGVVIVLVNAI